MNGSEQLLPFVIAERRRQADQAVLARLAFESRNSEGAHGGSVTHLGSRIRRRMTAVLDRGQMGPVACTA